jgi:histidine triad (HIT) family protein
MPGESLFSHNSELCAFCEIAAGRRPASIVHQDELTMTFLDVRQYHAGHVLVIPRRHVPDMRVIDDALACAIAVAVARAARAVDRAFPADGLSIWHSIGAGAHQEVPHLHYHVHPRQTGDDLLRIYPAAPALPDRATLDQWAEQLATAMSGGTSAKV